MGRPLNKKYFGNNNTPPIGGEGIASINWSQLGSFRGDNGANNPLVGLALPAPTLPNGVQATWVVTLEVASVTTGAGKAGLNVGDTYTYAGVGDPVITVASTSGANATFTVTDPGTGFDLMDLPGDTTTVNITKLTGAGAATFTVDINFKIKLATITNPGSGYTGAETFTVTLYPGAVGTPPAGTIVLEGAKQNAIVAYAYVGGGVEVVDIAKQTRSRGYNVVGASGSVNNAMLTGSTASAAGEMNISAADSNGGQYWVMKLTNGNALVKQKGAGPWEFADMTEVSWTFTAEPRPAPLAAGVNVKIDNA
jgi:hypothetical protein